MQDVTEIESKTLLKIFYFLFIQKDVNSMEFIVFGFFCSNFIFSFIESDDIFEKKKQFQLLSL